MEATATYPLTPATIHRPERTTRDRELLRYVGRHGIVSIAHVMSVLGVGQAAAYRRVGACIDAGLLERLDLLRHEPSLLRATYAGLRYAGLGLPVPVVSPGAVDHWLRCATTAQLLAEEFGPESVLTERELRLAERIEGRPLASAKLGELPSGHPRLHRPDLVIMPAAGGEYDRAPATLAGTSDAVADRIAQGGQGVGASAGSSGREAEQLPIAIEVELTPKAPRRLLSIIRAWRGAEWVAEVRYYCEPGPTRRAVEKAVAKTYAAERVRVLEAVAR